jgi:hypothetical protein
VVLAAVAAGQAAPQQEELVRLAKEILAGMAPEDF